LKDYTADEKEAISVYALGAASNFARNHGKSEHPSINFEEMISLAGLTIARWFAEDSYRPFNPSKNRSVKYWVAAVVVWSIKSWIRLVTGSKRSTFTPLEMPFDFTLCTRRCPVDFIERLTIQEEVERVKKAATRKQLAIISCFLEGRNWSRASLAAGLYASAYIHHLRNLREMLGEKDV